MQEKKDWTLWLKTFIKEKTPYFPQNESGFVLVVSLVLMLVLTVMGVLALSTSTSEVMVSGNQRVKELNLSFADGARELSRPVIDDVVYYDNIDKSKEKFPFIEDDGVNDPDSSLADELQTCDSDGDGITNLTSNNHQDNTDSLMNPDLKIPSPAGVQPVLVSVDIDYLLASLAEGSAIEVNAGYEGMGMGAGSGGSNVFYKVNSYGRGNSGSESSIGSLYRYINR